MQRSATRHTAARRRHGRGHWRAHDSVSAAAAAADSVTSDRRPAPSSLSMSTSRCATLSCGSVGVRVLPDRRSRCLFLPVLLGVLVAFALWLHWTITARWVAQVDHPTVVLTQERLPHVPAMQGLALQFPAEIFDIPYQMNESTTLPSNTLEHFILPKAEADPSREPGAGIVCDQVGTRNTRFICQPTQNGRRVFGHDSTAAIPDLTDPAVWSRQLTSATENVCFNIFSFFNLQQVLDAWHTNEMPYQDAYFQSHLVEPEELIGINRFIDGIIPFSAEELLAVTTDISDVRMLQYNRLHSLSYNIAKHVDVAGSSSLQYTIGSRDELRLTQSQVNSSISFLLASRPDVAARVTAWMADPSMGYLVTAICYTPSSMNAIVSTEQQQYGVFSFLSDLGGFLNLAILALTLLFPLVQRVNAPRAFFGFVLATLLQRGGDDRANKQAEDCPTCGHSTASAAAIDLAPRPSQQQRINDAVASDAERL